jgi:dienelactone hydrolase
LEPSKPDLGIYYNLLEQLSAPKPSLSFLEKDGNDVESWKKEARKAALDLMEFKPKNAPLNPSVESTTERDGIRTEEISYDMPYGPRAHGFFLSPSDRQGKIPGVVALHDHGGYFYWGKEKIVDTGIQSKLLDTFRARHYGGRYWATELAKKGYAVLAMDVFLWGSRKIPMDTINPELLGPFHGLQEGSDAYMATFNHYWDNVESSIMASSLLNAGASWPAIYNYEDQRAVDYLVTRPEVDTDRLACGGLSGGGIRSVYLTGLEPRLKAGFCVGFMCTITGMLRNHIRGNGVIMYVPHLFQLLDMPDIISVHGPSPLLVQYLEGDGLFTLEGQRAANQKITDIYAKMGKPGNYVGKFYPGHHRFDAGMQEDAFEWLKTALK